MTNDQKEFLDAAMKLQYITEEKHLKLLHEIVSEMRGADFSQDTFINLIRNVNAEIVSDLLKLMYSELLIDKQQYDDIDTKLMELYQEEFIRDEKNGVFESRMKLKTDKNPRPISLYEIMGIYFRNELDEKYFIFNKVSENELINRLVKIIKELQKSVMTTRMHKKFNDSLETVLTDLLRDVTDLKINVPLGD